MQLQDCTLHYSASCGKKLTDLHCTGYVQVSAATPVSPWWSVETSVEGCEWSVWNSSRDET